MTTKPKRRAARKPTHEWCIVIPCENWDVAETMVERFQRGWLHNFAFPEAELRNLPTGKAR